MRLRRSHFCAIATIVCSLFAVPATAAAKGPTVAGELKRLAADGTLTPEDAAAKRVVYDEARPRSSR